MEKSQTYLQRFGKLLFQWVFMAAKKMFSVFLPTWLVCRSYISSLHFVLGTACNDLDSANFQIAFILCASLWTLATPSKARLYLYRYLTIWYRMDILWISDVKQQIFCWRKGTILLVIRTIANETEFKFHVIIFLYSAPSRCETWSTQAELSWGLLTPGFV